jgi:hypothetical protein
MACAGCLDPGVARPSSAERVTPNTAPPPGAVAYATIVADGSRAWLTGDVESVRSLERQKLIIVHKRV